jgi:hypothetical protein
MKIKFMLNLFYKIDRNYHLKLQEEVPEFLNNSLKYFIFKELHNNVECIIREWKGKPEEDQSML